MSTVTTAVAGTTKERASCSSNCADNAADRYLICVGSVSASRDASALSRDAVYDDAADTILFHAVADKNKKTKPS